MEKDVTELLSTLRDLNLPWIAEEIEEAIHSGKSIKKEIPEIYGGRKTKKASMIVPLSGEEQLILCFETIKAYFVDLSDIWEKAIENIQQTEKLATAGVQISEIDSKEPITLFMPAYVDQKVKLADLITEGLQS